MVAAPVPEGVYGWAGACEWHCGRFARGVDVDAVIGIEVEAADLAAWEAARFSFQKALSCGVGTWTASLAPANDDGCEGAAGTAPGGAAGLGWY